MFGFVFFLLAGPPVKTSPSVISLFLDTRLCFTSKKWCKTQQFSKLNHYLGSNLHSLCPSDWGLTAFFLFIYFLSEKRSRPQSGVLKFSFKRAIVVPSLPVAADSFVLNQFALRAPSAGFQRA